MGAQMLIIGSRYAVLVSDSFDLDHIKATFDPSNRIAFSGEESVQIERIWAETVKANPSVYNGFLPRLLSFQISGNCLLLELGLTDFKEYIATERLLLENSNVLDASQFASPLAVSAVTKTRDCHVLVEIRSSKVVFSTKGKMHVKPSGHVVATTTSLVKQSATRVPYPFLDAVATEALEELSLSRDEILGITCTGLIRSLPNQKPELMFVMETSIDSKEIIGRPKAHGWESERLLAIPYEPDRIWQLLADELPNFTSPGHAALLLAGRRDFGEDWSVSLLAELNSK
jgi:hypothetical protein